MKLLFLFLFLFSITDYGFAQDMVDISETQIQTQRRRVRQQRIENSDSSTQNRIRRRRRRQRRKPAVVQETNVIIEQPVLEIPLPPKITHRIGFSTAWTIQTQPLAEVASLQNTDAFYAKQYSVWKLGSVGTGFGANFSYDFTLRNNFMTRCQTGIEMTGSILWVLECGLGIRIPIKSNQYFSAEMYFSTAHTWTTLDRVLPNPALPDSVSSYVGFFGFKARLAYEVPLGEKGYFTTYISYAAYPWHVSGLTQSDFFVNGRSGGLALDSLQIGLEFGVKIPQQ